MQKRVSPIKMRKKNLSYKNSADSKSRTWNCLLTKGHWGRENWHPNFGIVHLSKHQGSSDITHNRADGSKGDKRVSYFLAEIEAKLICSWVGKVRTFWEGNIHVLRNQDLGFSDPPPPPFVITFSTERNQKLPFSDPPPLPPLWLRNTWMFPNKKGCKCQQHYDYA